MAHHARVELICALTLWSLWAAFLLFPRFGLPVYMQRAAAWLGVGEVVAILAYSYNRVGCTPDGCPLPSRGAETIAAADIPALAVLLYVLALGYGLRRARAAVTTRSR